MKKMTVVSMLFTLAFSFSAYGGYIVEPPEVQAWDWEFRNWEKEEELRQYESWTNPSIEEIKQIEDETERYRAVFNMVCNHLSYNLEKRYYSQVDAIVFQEGVCEHYAKAIHKIGEMCNLDVELIYGWNCIDGVDHAWNRITINGIKYWTDASAYDSSGNCDYCFLSEKQFAGVFSNEELSAIYDAMPEGYHLQLYTDGSYEYIKNRVLTEEEKQELYENYGITLVD